MKDKKTLFITLAAIGGVALITSLLINFILKNVTLVSYLVVLVMFLGIIASFITIYFGSDLLKKSNHKILSIALLEIVFTFLLTILNTVYGYKRLLNLTNYSDYMLYSSGCINLYIYLFFVVVIGFLTLHAFVKNKIDNLNK